MSAGRVTERDVTFDGQFEFSLYSGDSDLRAIEYVVQGPIPLEVGQTFVCRVTGIRREVVDRGDGS